MTRTQRRLIYTALLLVAGVLMVMAFMIHPEPTKPARPPAVVAVSPGEGDTEIRQTTIFAELASGFDGELRINSRVIPKDQEERLSTGNTRIGFTPGKDKEIPAFPPGHNCAEIRFWPVDEGPQSASNYSWCFTLH